MKMSEHARQRAAQRSVPIAVIEAIFAYGEEFATLGRVGPRLTRDALKLAADDLLPSEIERLRRFIDVLIITSGEAIITVIRTKSRRLF